MDLSTVKSTIKAVLRGACRAVSPVFAKKADITPEQAAKMLANFWPCPMSAVSCQNTLADITCDLQIVIPAYNVEDYLEECMESVLNQKTTYTYHVVLVDDGAKDNTPAICDQYAGHPNVTVIHQENRGLSGARNTGMRELFGRYILFLDSDDLLCEGAVQGLLDTAYAHDCDLVEGGAYYLIEGKQTVMHRYDQDSHVTNPYVQLHGHAWGKLYRRELLENLDFPEGYWYEDSVLSLLIFSMAKNIWQSGQMTTAYRINQGGIVKSSVGKPRAVETYYITELLLEERRKAGLLMDEAFYSFMLLQIRLNQYRVKDLEETVQEAVFVLTCDLLEQYFAPEVMTGREGNLIRALKRRDFGMFKMCCKFF